jgi:hypothetical protein
MPLSDDIAWSHYTERFRTQILPHRLAEAVKRVAEASSSTTAR